MNEGERLIAYTDGVIETRNPSGNFYSLDYLFADIQARGRRPLAGLSQSILDAVDAWRFNGDVEDDVTVLAMCFQEVAALRS